MNGIRRRPAASIVASLASGSLPGEPSCAGTRAVVSSISPMLAFTSPRYASSSSSSTPAFVCGRSPRPIASRQSRRQ